MTITIKATDIESFREKLGLPQDASVTFAEAMRQYSAMMGPAANCTALAVALEHLGRASIAAEEDLAALGIKRLPGNV